MRLMRLKVHLLNQHSIQTPSIPTTNIEIIKQLSDIKMKKGTKIEHSKQVGQEIAKKALALGIKEVKFDRNGFKYIGRIKILADSARESGLVF